MSGTINIPGYPKSNRVPGVYAVVDASQANTGQANQVALLIGQMLPSGTATAGTAALSAGTGDAQTSFGLGSQLAIMLERYRALDNFGTVWCLPLADAEFVISTSAAQGAAGTTLQFAPGGVLGTLATGTAVTGTDIASSTTVQGVNAAAGTVTLSNATTAAVPASTAITFGSSVKATGSIAFTGTATAPAVLPLYVDGAYIGVSVNTGDTASVVATNTATAINAWTTGGGNPLSLTAAASSSTVTLTQRHYGSIGNQSTIILSYLGTAGGQGQPGTTNVPGITATITGFSGGTTDPTLTVPLANLPAQSFDFICCPLHDSTSLGAITSFLSDASGRWNWSSELFGGAFTAYNGTFSARTTWSTALNSQHLTGIGAYGSPSPDWHWAIDYCAASAVSLRANPAIPIGGLGGGVALNVLAPPLAQRDTFTERNTLLYDGMSTYVVSSDGTVLVERAITTYQQNSGGQPDDSYLDLNVPYQLAAYIRGWRSMIASNFNQAILVQNGNRIPPGSGMVTPQTILFATIANYQQQAAAGLVQNPQVFAQKAQATDAGGGVVNMLLPVMLASQLIAIAASVQFTQP